MESTVHNNHIQMSQMRGISVREKTRELTRISLHSEIIYSYFVQGPKGDQKTQNEVGSPILSWEQCQQVEIDL